LNGIWFSYRFNGFYGSFVSLILFRLAASSFSNGCLSAFFNGANFDKLFSQLFVKFFKGSFVSLNSQSFQCGINFFL